jgi:GTP-binding protein EngB required for normal cell division
MPEPSRTSTGRWDGVETLREICAAFRIETLAPQIEALLDARKHSGMVDVAVLGQFKTGKSSFLNSLIGRDILPVDVLPVTAVVTRIGFGPSDRMTVHRVTGEVEEYPVERIAEFVTERQNPDNEKRVSLVDLLVTSSEAWEGIRFVDTPGLGSIFYHNTQASLDWLPKVGTAFVAVSVNHPFSVQDLALLKEAAHHTPEIVVLLTKADLVSEAQRKSVVEFMLGQLLRHTGREARIFPFSILPSFKELRRDVAVYLQREISERHEEKSEEILAHKFLSLISSCREYLQVAGRAAAATEKARRDLREVLRRERDDLGAIGREIWLFAQDQKSKVRTRAGEKFRSHAAELCRRLDSVLGSRLEEFRGNLAETTRLFREWMVACLAEELGTVSIRGEEYLSTCLSEAQSALHRMARAFQDRMAVEIERALGMRFSGAQLDTSIREPARPSVKVGYVFDIPIDLLWFLIPMPVFRGWIRRRLLGRIRWEVEKNLSRLAGQWADALNSSIDDLVRQANEFIHGELATVEQLVSDAEDRRPEIARALDELSRLERRFRDRPVGT